MLYSFRRAHVFSVFLFFDTICLIFVVVMETTVMYEFHIVKNDEHSWRLEKDGINLIVDDYFIKNEKHYLKNPSKAIAFFNVSGLLYGISNGTGRYYTAEDFFDVMSRQYSFFR
jgi:hypothetical protein